MIWIHSFFFVFVLFICIFNKNQNQNQNKKNNNDNKNIPAQQQQQQPVVKLNIRKDEKPFYEALYSRLDPNNTGMIKGPAVRDLFPLSKLPKKTLAEVFFLNFNFNFYFYFYILINI